MEPWTIGPPNFVMSPSRAAGLPPLIAKSFCKTSECADYAGKVGGGSKVEWYDVDSENA
jgi:hypothetical protein